jgi:hypothetical protein
MALQICLTTTEKLRFLQKKYRISPTKLFNNALVYTLKNEFKINPDELQLSETKISSAK